MVEIAVKVEVEVGGSPKYGWTYRQGKEKEKVDNFGEDVTMYLEHDGMIYMAVADGVGSWRSSGINPLIFPQALMKQLSKFCQGRTANKTSCSDLIQKAFAVLKEKHAQKGENYCGSCTVLAIICPLRFKSN